MAYGSFKRGGFGGNKKPIDKTKVGLFKSKNPALLTGTCKEESFDKLIEVAREAKKSGSGIVFFCWKNEYAAENPKAPKYRLSFAVNQDRDEDEDEPQAPKRRAIADDDDNDEDPTPPGRRGGSAADPF